MAIPRVQTAPKPDVFQLPPQRRSPEGNSEFAELLQHRPATASPVRQQARQVIVTQRSGTRHDDQNGAGPLGATGLVTVGTSVTRQATIGSGDSQLEMVAFAFSELGVLGFDEAGGSSGSMPKQATQRVQPEGRPTPDSGSSASDQVVVQVDEPDLLPAPVGLPRAYGALQGLSSFDPGGASASTGLSCGIVSPSIGDEEPMLAADDVSKLQPETPTPREQPINPANVVVSGENDALTVAVRAAEGVDHVQIQALFAQTTAEFGGRIGEIVINGSKRPIGGFRGHNTR